MNQRELTPPRLNLSGDPLRDPIRIEMEAFFEFSFWLAEELEDLVALHLHRRPPARFGYDFPMPSNMPQEWSIEREQDQ